MNETETNKQVEVYILTGLLAACSLTYELIVAQSISLLAGNTVVWYAITVGVFLCAMGVGAVICEKITKKSKKHWGQLVYVELLLSTAGALAVPFINSAHMLNGYWFYHSSIWTSILVFFLPSVLWGGLIGFLSGIELPLLMQIANTNSCEKESFSNRVLAADYLGSLIGAVTFPYIVIANLEVLSAGFLLSAVNLIIALYIVFTKCKIFSFKSVYLLVLGFAVSLGIFNQNFLQQFFLQKYYFYHYANDSLSELFKFDHNFKKVEHFASPYQKIDLVRDDYQDVSHVVMSAYSNKFLKYPDYPRGFALFLNGDWQFMSDFDEVYHEYFAHVPMILTDKIPEKILVLGGGDGLLIRELLKYKEVKNIHHIDIDSTLINLAKTHPKLLKMNRRSLFDPRVQFEQQDAFHFLRHTSNTYDAIFMDFPAITDYNLSKLFSAEFFSFARKRLTKSGFLSFDASGIGLFTFPEINNLEQKIDPDNNWKQFQTTLKAGGFSNILPYVSTLEVDNPQVIEVLAQAVGLNYQESEINSSTQQPIPNEYANRLAIHNAILENMFAFQQGFVFASKGDKPQVEFKDFGVEMHILNEKRFNLAFNIKFPDETPRKEVVNSIFNPSMPTGTIFLPKVPW